MSCLHPWLVWAVLLAVPVHGVSNVLLQVMGAAHRHHAVTLAVGQGPIPHSDGSDASDTAPWTARSAVRDLVARVAGPGALALIDAMHARDHAWQHAHNSAHGHAHQPAHQHAHQHAHDTFQRHIHDLQDTSVVALGGQTAQAADAGGSAPTLDAGGGTFPLSPVLNLPAISPGDAVAAWRRTAPSDWRSHVVTPLERPPQA